MNTDKETEKRLSAETAIEHVEDGMIVGVGTGSTVAYFIDALGRIKSRIEGAVSSSEQSTARLKALGIQVLDSEPHRRPGALRRRRRRMRSAQSPDQGRRRGADAREDHRRRVEEVRLPDRCRQAGERARQVPAAGGGDPDGAQLRRPPDRQARRPAGVARRRGHRQRQLDPRRAQPDASPTR